MRCVNLRDSLEHLEEFSGRLEVMKHRGKTSGILYMSGVETVPLYVD